MRPAMSRLALAAAAGAVVLVAGCAGNKATPSDPKAALTQGFGNVADSSALTVTIKLETTASALQRFAREDGDTLDPATAQALASAALVFEAKTDNGKDLSDTKGAAGHTSNRVSFQTGGKTYAELRSVAKALYVQADVKGLLTLFQKPKVYDNLQAQASSLPTFVKALVSGQWVTINLDAVKALSSQFGGGATTNPSQNQKFVADLRAILAKDVTVTRVGKEDLGDHLKLTGQTRQLASDLVTALRNNVPASSAALGSFDATKVPQHSIVIDAWVKDGTLTKLSLDLVQFSKPGEAKPGDHLPVVMTFDQSGDDIDAPSGATPVDLTQLGTLLGALSS